MINIMKEFLKKNDSVLFWAEPGVEAEPFMLELLNKHLSKGFKAVLCVSDKKTLTLLDEAGEYGFKLKKYVNKSLILLDFYKPLLNKAPINLEKTVKNAINKLGANTMICFNSLSSIVIEIFEVIE